MSRTAGDVVRTGLRGLGQVLITFGIVVLLFSVYELKVTNLYTARAQGQLAESLADEWAAPAPSAPAAEPALGAALARVHMPRIYGQKSKVVVEGISVEDLKRGVGHFPGTALPGQVGNFVMSGHRTTYGAPFNRLDELKVGDAVVIETRDTWFTYRVTGSEVVSPRAIEVTFPVPRQPNATPTKRLLTMTTCNPKYSARTRLIVSGELEASHPKSQGRPPALQEEG